MRRPESIVTFGRCYVGAWLLGVANLLVSWNTRLSMIDTPAAEAMFGRRGLAGVLVGGIVLGAVITLGLWYLIAKRASVAAKWVVVVFFGLGLLGVLTSLSRGTMVGGIGGDLTIISIVLQAIAVTMLFRSDAVAWFASRRRRVSL